MQAKIREFVLKALYTINKISCVLIIDKVKRIKKVLLMKLH